MTTFDVIEASIDISASGLAVLWDSVTVSSKGRILELSYPRKFIQLISSLQDSINFTSSIVRQIDLESTLDVLIDLVSSITTQIDITSEMLNN